VHQRKPTTTIEKMKSPEALRFCCFTTTSNSEFSLSPSLVSANFLFLFFVFCLQHSVPETWQFAVGGTCFCIVLIISIVLIAVSFSTLEPNEVGLDVNANTMYLDKGAYGRVPRVVRRPCAQKIQLFFFFFFFSP
jgi:protein-S-isoprenylcysteine O-methyltransferase Ste14